MGREHLDRSYRLSVAAAAAVAAADAAAQSAACGETANRVPGETLDSGPGSDSAAVAAPPHDSVLSESEAEVSLTGGLGRGLAAHLAALRGHSQGA